MGIQETRTIDLCTTLGQKLSLESRDKVLSYIGNDPERFKALFDCFKNAHNRIRQNAAWALSVCIDQYPRLIQPYLDELILYLKIENIPDGVKRNILRILQGVEIPKNMEGELMNICFQILMDKREAVAIRVFSMQVLANLSQLYQDIQPELKIIIEDELPYAQPAFLSRGQKILRNLGR